MTRPFITILPLLPLAFWRALQRFIAHQGVVFSSHVAMSLMLALFPFVLFVVAMAGALFDGVNTEALFDLLFGAWPPEIATPLEREIRAVLTAQSTGLMTLGGGLALYFASNGIEAIRVAISSAYDDVHARPFWANRLISLVFVIAGSVFILVGLTLRIGLPAYVYVLTDVMPDVMPDAVGDWMNNMALQRFVPLLLVIAGVLAIHLWLPARRRALRQIWPGVGLSLILWFLAIWAFSLYVSQVANYSATYAGLAGAMSALIFLYLMAAILILGAEFNAALRQMRASRQNA